MINFTRHIFSALVSFYAYVMWSYGACVFKC